MSIGAVPAPKDLKLHFQVGHDNAMDSPFFHEIEVINIVGVSLSIKVELATELVDELGMDRWLIENWHHGSPKIEIHNEVAEKAE